MATPAFRSAGTYQASTGSNVTPGLPAGYQADDIFLCFVEHDSGQYSGQPAGYTTLFQLNLGDLYWKRASASETAPSIDSGGGDHVSAQVLAFSGCIADGSPIVGGDYMDAAGTGTSFSTGNYGASPIDETLLVAAVFWNTDTASAQASGWTNSNVTGLTERTDNSTTVGNGGGFAVATGDKASAGTIGATTGTLATSAGWRAIALLLAPPEKRTGAGAAIVPAVVGSAAGQHSTTGSGGAVVGNVLASALGALAIAGAGALAISAMSSSGAGEVSDPVDINGSGNAQIGAVTSSGSGALSIAGQGAAAIGPIVSFGSGAPIPPVITPPGRILTIPVSRLSGRTLDL